MKELLACFETPLAIFDMDGTVREGPRNARAHQIRIIDGIGERIQELKRLGYFVIGVTNQSGVSRGEITAAEVEETNKRTCELLGDAAPEEIYYCPHYGPKDGRNCDCKKPAPGMVIKALANPINTDRTLNGAIVIGNDALKDGGLAAGLTLPYIPVQDFLGWPVTQLAAQIRRLHRVEPTIAIRPDQALGTMFGLIIGSAAGLKSVPTSGAYSACSEWADVDECNPARNATIPWTNDAAMAMMVAHTYCRRQGTVDGTLRTLRCWSYDGICFDDFPGIVLKQHSILPAGPGRVFRALLMEEGLGTTPTNYYEQNPGRAAGNGALVRSAPVALFHINSLPMLIADSRLLAQITHADPRAQSGCVILNLWLRDILVNGAKDGHRGAVKMLPSTEQDTWKNLTEIEHCQPAEIKSGTYVVHTLEAAAWAFLTTDSFDAAIERAVSLGGDADSVGAVVGALAGAYYGVSMVGQRSDLRIVQYSHFVERLTLETTSRGMCEHTASRNKHDAAANA